LLALKALLAAIGTSVLVGGCSIGPVHVVSAPPLDYRQLVSTSSFAAKLRAKPSLGPLEVSGLQKTVLGEPGDWRTCLRTTKSGQPIYFAVFFAGEAIRDTRQSVAIDRCEQEQQFLTLLPPKPKQQQKPILTSKTSKSA
jgi:hypothetical protein